MPEANKPTPEQRYDYGSLPAMVCAFCGCSAKFLRVEGCYRHADNSSKPGREAQMLCEADCYPVPVIPADYREACKDRERLQKVMTEAITRLAKIEGDALYLNRLNAGERRFLTLAMNMRVEIDVILAAFRAEAGAARKESQL